MSGTRYWAALVIAGLAACTPEDQTPLESDTSVEVSKRIDTSGGTISSPAGISLALPAGALASPTEISVKPVSGAGLGAGINGTLLPGTAYELAPLGLVLSQPARLELSTEANSPGPSGDNSLLFNRVAFDEVPGPSNGLGYFVLVDAGPGGRHILSQINLDIDRKVISSWISTLGLVSVGYTTPLTLQPSGQFNAVGGTIHAGDYEFRCGLEETSCVGLSGNIRIGVYTDPSVIGRYPKIGAIITKAQGTMTFNTATQTVTGAAKVEGVVQAVVGGTVTSKSVSIEVSSGSQGTIHDPTGVQYQVSGNKISFETANGWESFDYTATDEYFEVAISSTTIPLTDADGIEREYPISLVLRLQRSTGD